MKYFETFYLSGAGGSPQILLSLYNDFPFPTVHVKERVTIQSTDYQVLKREQLRTQKEVVVKYYVVKCTDYF